jgi:pimeloyl-ACP methyl ester carboxylesterase
MTKPSVVLLHGFTGTARVWDTVADDLARDHDVHALPIAGHRGGKPVVRGEVLPIEFFVDELEADLERARIRRPHLVGNSMGGWLALELAERGGAASVYALCPAGFWKGADDPANDAVRQMFARADADARRTRHVASAGLRIPLVRRLAFQSVARHGDRLSHAAAVEAVKGVRECTAYPGALDGAKPGARHYEALDCPVTVRMGEHDRFFPPSGFRAEIQRRIPEAELEVLPGVGHVPMIDDPVLVAADVRAWVSTVRAC